MRRLNAKLFLGLFGPVTAVAVFAIPPCRAGDSLKNFTKELHQLIDSTKVSVVTVASRISREVYVEKESGILSFFRPEKEKQAISYLNVGSGLIVDTDGHVVTRRSIVAGSDWIHVMLHDGREVPAYFIGEDPETGFAVLRVKAEGLQPARLGRSYRVRPGTWTVMIGNSLGAFPSVEFGAVNGVRKDGFIQISANLNPGNNGSPVFDLEGEVIGLVIGRINAAQDLAGSFDDLLHSETTLVYPIDWVRRIAEDLIAVGHVRKGWLGVAGDFDAWQPRIKEVKADSPAQRAGLVSGDVILAFGGMAVGSLSQLMRMVEYTLPGETVTVRFRRDDEVLEVEVEIGERPAGAGAGLSDGVPGFDVIEVSNETTLPLSLDWPQELLDRNQVLEKRVLELQRELNRLKKVLESR